MKAMMVRLIACAFGLTVVLGLAFGWWSKGSQASPTPSLPQLQAEPGADNPVGQAPEGIEPRVSGGNNPRALTARHAGEPGTAQPSLPAESIWHDAAPAPGSDPRTSASPQDAGMSAVAPRNTGLKEPRTPGRSCANNSDCPSGQGCIFEPRQGTFSCQPPDCQQDGDCPDNQVCRVASSVISGDPIRRCISPGTQREGGACYELSSDNSQMCGAGLLCVRGRCGKACEENTIGSCPAGSTCVGTVNGAGCLPTCREGQCPKGQECLEFGGEPLCAARVGENCLTGGCADGKVCNVTQAFNTVIFECKTRCSPFRPDSCPTGSVCGAGSNGQSLCYQGCDFTNRPCPQGFECSTVTEDLQTLGCRRVGP